MTDLLRKKLFFAALALAAFSLLFSACENIVGLGKMVNTEKPVISIPGEGDNQPGSFLSGAENQIELSVEQPFGLDNVYLTVWYKCLNGCADCEGSKEHEMKVPAKFVDQPPPGKWVANLDTSDMADGKIRAQVTAIDLDGQSSTTTDLIYTVKNMPPQIELTIPSVKDTDFDSLPGHFDNFNSLNEYLVSQDPIFVGFDLMGIATDNRGIDIEGGYPKIMIWPSSEDDGTGNPKPGKWAHWRSTKYNARPGATTLRFNWPMKDLITDPSDPTGWRLPSGPDESHNFLPPGTYRFRLWIKDTFGGENFYPHRIDNKRGPGGKPEKPNTTLNYMEIRHLNQDLPIVTYMSVPPYFNGEGYISEGSDKAYIQGDYPVYITVTSSADVLTGNVKGWVADADDTFKSPEYDFIHDPTQQNPNRWSLKITKDDVYAWFEQITPTGPLKDDDNKNRDEVTLFIKAKATNINNDSSPPDPGRNFNFDMKPPSVIVDRPVTVPIPFAYGTIKSGKYEIFYPLRDTLNPMPRWITGQITVGGSNLDGFGLSKIYYHIGNLKDDSPHDDITREAIYNEADWKDTEVDKNGSTDQYGGMWSGSLYAWNYQNNFNEWGRHKNCQTPCSYPLCSQLKDLIQEGTELIDFDSSHVNYTTKDKTRFYLPFYVKVVDTAGNFHILQYKLCVDPDLDIPYVSISTPAHDGPTKPIIGGEVSLSGLATDNDWIHSVQIRIKKYGSGSGYTENDDDGKGDYKYYRPYRHNTTNIEANLIPLVYENNPNFPLPDGETRNEEAMAGWFNAEKRNNDMVIGWFFNINTYGGLDPENGAKQVDVRIEVRAVDSKDRGTHPDKVGASVIVDVEFSSGVPTISNPLVKKSGTIDRSYFEGITASGRFDVSMLIGDDGNLQNIRASINGTRFDLLTNRVNLSTNSANVTGGLKITDPVKPTETSRSESTLTLDINTLGGNSLYSALGLGKTGTITIEVEVHDDSTPTFITRTRYTIGIDNYYPTTTIETTTNASSSKDALPPTNFELSGVASDTGEGSGTLQELARVLIYFEKLDIRKEDGTLVRTKRYFNPRGIEISRADYNGVQDSYYNKAIYTSGENASISSGWHLNPVLGTYPNVVEADDKGGAWGKEFTTFPILRQVNKGDSVGVVWESPHAMVIDSHELSEDLDTDGTFGEAWSGLVEKTWRAWMDTEEFTDGPYMVHYIVMDAAGNATHSMKDIFIENNKPEIAYINLGTNIKGLADDSPSAPWNSITDYGDYMRVRYSIEGTASGNRLITFTDTMDNPFRIRGNKLALHLETSKGNGNKFYKVSYVEPLGTIQATNMLRGQVYTIVTSGTTDWQKYGAVNNSVHTTFVASGPGEGNGTVLRYNEVKSSAPKQIPSNGNIDNDIVFRGNADFGSTIPDSRKTAGGDILRPYPAGQRPAGWPAGWDNSWPERLFIIKVFDETVPGMGEEHQLAHAVLVALDIDNNDSKAPVINPAAFGRKFALPATGGNIDNEANRIDTAVSNYNENIIMSGDAKQGYVQYAGHSGGTAQISGQVIFTGKASDNQRIKNITVTIPGYNGSSAFTVATWPDDTTNGLVSERETMGTANNQRWYFKIIDQSLSLDYGHTINWEFGWDSSYVTDQVGTPSGGVVFTVNDFRASGAAVTGNLAVNIVPYISEISTGLSGMYGAAPSAFARSSAGWYPVRESETVTIRGFNLGTDGSAITSVVYIGGTITGTAAPTGGTNITPAVSGNRNAIQLNVGTAAMSGDLTVRVNNVNSINNRTQVLNSGVADTNANRRITTNRVAYNWEPNNVNNNMLTNDRKLYVWSVGNILSTAIEYPHLSVSPNGTRFMAYNRTTTSIYRNTNDTEALLETSINRYLNITTAYGNNNLWYVGTSNQTAQADNSYAIHARATSSGAANANGSNKARILNLGTSTAALLPNRVRLPKVHAYDTSATSSRVVTSYFDELENRINFHYGTMTGTQAANNSTTNTSVVTRGGDFTNHHPTPQIVTRSTDTHNGSMYTAVATLSNGTPVIAWYSPSSDSIVFSHGISSAYTYTYTIANHGLAAGTANANRVLVRDGGNGGLGTIYFVRNVNGNVITFNVLSTVNTGQNLNAATVIRPIVGNNTAASSQTANGVTAYAYRMPTGHGLATGNQVVIFNSNNSMYYGPYVVREVGTAVGNALNARFAINSTTSNPDDFFNVNINAQNLCIYMINPITNTLTLPTPAVTESTTATVTTTTDQWQNNIVLIDTGKGSYVDMAVDGGDNIHLAYYDSNNGGLHYAYIPYSSATGFPNKGAIEKARVDTFLGAGTNIMINIRQEAGVTGGASGYRPYISYIHSSYATTRGAVRVAWPITTVTGTKYAVADNTDTGDLFLGTWEVMTVPVVNPPITPLYSTFVVTNGVPSTMTNWVKPAGINWPLTYVAGTASTHDTINKTVLIGFMAGTRYEGAVLKTSISDLKY